MMKIFDILFYGLLGLGVFWVKCAPGSFGRSEASIFRTDRVPVSSVPVSEPIVVTKDGRPDWFWAVVGEIKRREGVRLNPYRDSKIVRGQQKPGSMAIGYGRQISHAEAFRIKSRGGISLADAQRMLYEDIAKIRSALSRERIEMEHNQELAVVCLAYNCGLGNLKKKSLWKMIRRGDCGEAVTREWMRTCATIPSHRKSREFESAMYSAHCSGRTEEVFKMAKLGHSKALLAIKRQGL